MPSIYKTDYRIVRPIFTSDNKLISVNGLRSFVIFQADNITSNEVVLPALVPTSATITCMYYIDAVAQAPGKLLIGTSEGHILQWIMDDSFLLLYFFPTSSISAVSHHSTSLLVIAMNEYDKNGKQKGSLIRIYKLSENQLKFDVEIYSKRYSSPIENIQPFRLFSSEESLLPSTKETNAFTILCKNSNLFLVYSKDQDIKWQSKSLTLQISAKYKSHLVSMLSVMKNVLIVGFSNGVIAFYLMKDENPILLTTIHWHCSPVRAMEWQKASKSLFSGASEGVLCHWDSPLAPFLRTISETSTPSNQKYARTTRPSTTLPGFGAAIQYISISSSGKMAIVTLRQFFAAITNVFTS